MNHAINLTLLVLLLASLPVWARDEQHDTREGHTSITTRIGGSGAAFEPKSPAPRRFAKRCGCTASSCRIRRACSSCARAIPAW